jgi:glucose-6-phosphate 1-dehydrogenase
MELSMTNFRSYALVLFGATGDLAYKKIFPAVQAELSTDSRSCFLEGLPS